MVVSILEIPTAQVEAQVEVQDEAQVKAQVSKI